MGAAVFGGPMATYTAVLLANTAVPSWHEPHDELPFVFAGSAMAAGGGITMALHAGRRGGAVAARWRVTGAAIELAAMHQVENGHGIVSEPYHDRPGRDAAAGGEGVHRCGRRADRRWPGAPGSGRLRQERYWPPVRC